MQSAAGAPPESQRGGFGGPPIARSQFVQLTADGTAIVRDLGTGTESARRAGATRGDSGGSGNQALAVDGILYVVDHDKPGTVRAVDMSGPAAATDVYTTANGMQVVRPLWCGPTQICFEEQGSSGDEHVTGFDTASRKVRWRENGSILRLQVVNGQILLNLMTRSGDPRSAVMDASGRQILSEQAQTGTAGWLDGNALLILGGRDRDAPVSVSGVSPLTGGPVQLGVVDGNRGCGWGRTHLVCVTITGIKVWRFAA
jgi:hypothetical protein